MVNVVIAGGSGGIGRHIAESIKASGRHFVVVFSRADNPSLRAAGIPVHIVDYSNHGQLVKSLEHAHTVISTLSGPGDSWLKAQGNLLKACVVAGVRRFVPSDFGPMPGPVQYHPLKNTFALELDWINAPTPVIEITSFKCGYIANQFSAPYRTSYLAPAKPFIDFEHCEAIIPWSGQGNEVVVVTQVEDVARFVTAALDIPEGKWPAISGIVGQRISVRDLVRMAEEIRGRPFKVYRESLPLLQAGIIACASEIHAPTHEQKPLTIPFLLALGNGMFDVPASMNKVFPHIRTTPLRDYLTRVWRGKPFRY